MLSLLSLLCSPAWSGETTPPEARVERRLAAMGTTLSLSVEAEDRATALLASEAAVRAVEAVEARLSTWRPDSALSVLGAAPVGEWTQLDPALAHDLALARWCWEQTEGAFDPAIGTLIAAWDLRGEGRQPDARELAEALEHSGLDGLEVGEGRARRLRPLSFDAGAFGKGIGLDEGLAAALAAGATDVSLDLGGQLLSHGRALAVDLAHPADRSRTVAVVQLDGGSVATSGHGEQPGHILDPRTGRPTAPWGSLTVLAPTAAQADCLSTGLYVLGPDAALAWAEEHPGFEIVVVEHLAEPPQVRVRKSAGAEHASQPGEEP